MNDKRTHCTVTMTPDLYAAVKAACKEADQPLTVWCREAIKAALKSHLEPQSDGCDTVAEP